MLDLRVDIELLGMLSKNLKRDVFLSNLLGLAEDKELAYYIRCSDRLHVNIELGGKRAQSLTLAACVLSLLPFVFGLVLLSLGLVSKNFLSDSNSLGTLSLTGLAVAVTV